MGFIGFRVFGFRNWGFIVSGFSGLGFVHRDYTGMGNHIFYMHFWVYMDICGGMQSEAQETNLKRQRKTKWNTTI